MVQFLGPWKWVVRSCCDSLAEMALTSLEFRQDLDPARPVADDSNGLACVIEILGPLRRVY